MARFFGDGLSSDSESSYYLSDDSDSLPAPGGDQLNGGPRAEIERRENEKSKEGDGDQDGGASKWKKVYASHALPMGRHSAPAPTRSAPARIEARMPAQEESEPSVCALAAHEKREKSLEQEILVRLVGARLEASRLQEMSAEQWRRVAGELEGVMDGLEECLDVAADVYGSLLAGVSRLGDELDKAPEEAASEDRQRLIRLLERARRCVSRRLETASKGSAEGRLLLEILLDLTLCLFAALICSADSSSGILPSPIRICGADEKRKPSERLGQVYEEICRIELPVDLRRVYWEGTGRQRVRAVLLHIYAAALQSPAPSPKTARDLFLLSHIKETIHSADARDKALYLRLSSSALGWTFGRMPEDESAEQMRSVNVKRFLEEHWGSFESVELGYLSSVFGAAVPDIYRWLCTWILSGAMPPGTHLTFAPLICSADSEGHSGGCSEANVRPRAEDGWRKRKFVYFTLPA